MQDTLTRVVETLKTNPIFKNIDEISLLEILRFHCEIKSFKRNEIILSPDDCERKLGAVISGSVGVKKGKTQMSILNKGEIFGAVTLFSNEAFPATTIYANVECEIVFIPKAAFEKLLWSDRKITEDFLSYLTERIRFLTSRIESLTAGGCEQKLLAYLNSAQKDGIVKISSCAELARKLDVGRASLYRAIDSLSNENIISRQGNTFIFVTKPTDNVG